MAAKNETFKNMAMLNADADSSCLGVCCVLLLRAGFIFIELGSVPITDLKQLVFQNIIDLACGTVAYCLIGYSFAYGRDVRGFIGTGKFFMSDVHDMRSLTRGWAAAVTASGLFTMGVAGRLHPIGAAVASTWLCGLPAPLFQHWAWHERGWCKWIFRFTDQGGGVLIHGYGGTAALVGVLTLGRRLLRLRDMDECSLPPGSSVSAVVGFLLLLLGYAGVAATGDPPSSVQIFVNSVLAAAGGWIALALMRIRSDSLDHWTLLRVVQGGVSGCIMVAAGVGLYSAPIALVLGLGGGALSCLCTYAWDATALEDNACVVPSSLLCGFVGALMPPIFAHIESSSEWVEQLGKQFLCALVMVLTTMVLVVAICFILMCLGLLRNRAEIAAHKRALSALNHSEYRPFFRRLFPPRNARLMQPGYRDKGLAIVSGRNVHGEKLTPTSEALIQTSTREAVLIDSGPHQRQFHALKDFTKNQERGRKILSIRKDSNPSNRTRKIRKLRERRKRPRLLYTLPNLRRTINKDIRKYEENRLWSKIENILTDVSSDESDKGQSTVTVVRADIHATSDSVLVTNSCDVRPDIAQIDRAEIERRHLPLKVRLNRPTSFPDRNLLKPLFSQIEASSCPELDVDMPNYESLLQTITVQKSNNSCEVLPITTDGCGSKSNL